MKRLVTQRRLAAKLLKVGRHRIVFDQARLADIREAITAADIKDLIKDRAIKVKPAAGIKRRAGKQKRQRRGPGKKKKSVKRKKERYVALIRKLRARLAAFRASGLLSGPEYKKLRTLAKAGQFRSARHLEEYMTSVLKKELKPIEKKKVKIKRKKK